MSHTAELDDRAILSEAAEWFAVLADDQASEADRTRWRHWLEAHPAHQRAWQRVEAISQPFNTLGHLTPTPGVVRETLNTARRRSRRRLLGSALGVAAVGIGLGGLGGPGRDWLSWQPWWHAMAGLRLTLRTALGEVRSLRLADGSEIVLGPASDVAVDYGATRRQVQLLAGEILITSAKDSRTPARDLVVDTPQGRITALGTRFTVRDLAGRTQVAVFDGAVRLAPRNGTALELAAGWQADFDDRSITAPRAAEPAREAWARGLLIADDVPLGRFVQELQRYTRIPLTVTPAAAAHRLVGVYPFDQPARDLPRLLLTLERVLPVRVQARPEPGGIVIDTR